MKTSVHIKLYATLKKFVPASGKEDVPIQPGITVENLLEQLDIPKTEAKLIFIDGTKASLSSPLRGGERVGLFPPIGGG